MARVGGKREGAGRPKGSKNKRQNKAVKDLLEEMGCDPIEGMAKIAMDTGNDIQHRISAYKELAQYIYPKKRAVEVSGGESGEPVRFEMVLSA